MERRDFLKASAAGAGYFSLSGLTLIAPSAAEAAAATVNLVAELAQKTLAWFKK